MSGPNREPRSQNAKRMVVSQRETVSRASVLSVRSGSCEPSYRVTVGIRERVVQLGATERVRGRWLMWGEPSTPADAPSAGTQSTAYTHTRASSDADAT
jgi:hypothetical protein